MGWNGDETPEVLKFIFHDGEELLRDILVAIRFHRGQAGARLHRSAARITCNGW